MQGHAKHSGERSTATVRRSGAACLAAALVALGVLVAGCGGSSPSGGVASLGSHASKTSTTSSTAAGSTGGRRILAGQPGRCVLGVRARTRRAQLPRPKNHHPRQRGERARSRSIRRSRGNPHFKSAQQACKKLLPGGGPGGEGNHQITPSEQAQYLKAAACIRSHGVPNFPDPTFSGGGVHIEHQGLNESSPAFKAAVQACESLIPGGVHGGSSSSPQPAP